MRSPILFALAALPLSAHAQGFASRVIDYSPAPGQFVNHSAFNDPSRALGAPVGGGLLAADLSSLVTLGGFGGSITLAFDALVQDDPGNPGGLDFIVYGSSFYVAGDPERRWAEAGIVEISLDTNANGLADDAWYLIPGSALAHPIALPLPAAFNGPVLENAAVFGSGIDSHWGYADVSPTLLLGDMDADNAVDEPTISPGDFYTLPDDPRTVGVDAGSGGGDAFDIAWAIDAVSGSPANLPAFHFIRITTGVDRVNGVFGEVSTEIDGVADVRALAACAADVNGDGAATPADFSAWIAAFNAGTPACDQNGDGDCTPADFSAWIANFNAGCG